MDFQPAMGSPEDPWLLVLSQFADVAKELGLCWSIPAVADAMATALDTPLAKQRALAAEL